MKIVAIYRHYFPDVTPYARNLRRILEHLVQDGHEATVITAQPSYNDNAQERQPARERLGGVTVYRLAMLPERKSWPLVRLINYVWFLLCSFLHVVINRKYDLIIANTHPPILMGMTLRWLCRLTRIPYLLHCQDIHPESAILSGHVRSNPLRQWLLSQDEKSCRSARCIVTLSQDMRQTFERRPRSSGISDKIVLINNPPLSIYHSVSEATLAPVFRRENPHAGSPFRVLFAGNMGPFQELERLVSAARILSSEPDIHFIFMGSGVSWRSLQKLAGSLVENTVFFLPQQSVEVAYLCMQRSDLGVVSLCAGLTSVAYPSKMMTYLAAGLPLLVLVDSDSDLVRDVQESQFGYVPTSLDPRSIAATIRNASRQRYYWSHEARSALTRRYESRFGPEVLLQQWSQLFHSLEQHGANWRRDMLTTAPISGVAKAA